MIHRRQALARPGQAAPTLLFVGSAACAGSGRDASAGDSLEFERDHERCVLRSEDHLGVRRPADYRAGMRARVWQEAPE